jgi:shikimate kinase
MSDPQLQGINLYLIGMPGCGKSTLGQALAKRLGYQFFDTDAVIEQLTQQSISDFFAASGEAKFRDLETQVLAELSAYTRLVVATGGGIVLRRMNWSHLRQGAIVWLDVPIEELQQRLQAETNRPLLQTGELSTRLHTLWNDRHSLYAQADLHISHEPDEPLPHLCDRVLTQLQAIVKSSSEPNGNSVGSIDLGGFQ